MNVSKRMEPEGGAQRGVGREGRRGGGGGLMCEEGFCSPGHFGAVLLEHIRASVIYQLLECSLYIIAVCMKSRTQIMSTKKPRQLNKLLEMSGF